MSSASETTDKALSDVNEMRRSLQRMRETLTSLVASKKEGRTSSSSYSSDSQKPILVTELSHIRQIRSRHRSVQISIEEERLKIRSEKEKIEKQSVYLAGLEYLHSTITSAILRCEAVKVEKLFSLPLIGKRSSNNTHSSIEQLSSLKEELHEELTKRVKKDEERADTSKQFQLERTKQESLINQFSSALPPVLLNLAENMKGLSTIFPAVTSTPLPLNPLLHALSSQLPPPLYAIYSKLSLLVETASTLSASVELVKTTNPAAVAANNKKKINEIAPIELVLTIREFAPSLLAHIEVTLANYKLPILKNALTSIYPYKISFRYIPTLNIVVAYLDSKSLKGKEVFSGLFEDDFGTQLITHAVDEYDKNLNSQYDCYNWLQALSGIINVGSRTAKIDAGLVLTRLNERVISKRVVRIIMDSLVSNSISFAPALVSAKEMVTASELLKYKFEVKQRLSNSSEIANSPHFRKFKPVWLSKLAGANLSLIEEEHADAPLIEQLRQNQQTPPSSVAYRELIRMLDIPCESSESEVYVVQLNKLDQFSAIVVIIMPLSTLLSFPIVKVLSGHVKMQSNRPTVQSIFGAEHVVVRTAETPEGSTAPSSTLPANCIPLSQAIIGQIEIDLANIGQLIPTPSSQAKIVGYSNKQFAILFQLNRLLTLAEITISHYLRLSSLATKPFAANHLDMIDI